MYKTAWFFFAQPIAINYNILEVTVVCSVYANYESSWELFKLPALMKSIFTD